VTAARPALDRREFLRLVGGGIVVLVSLGPDEILAQGRPIYPEDLNAYLRIAADGRVTVFAGKIEMGQGVMTSMAQMAAEELGVALGAVDMVMGDTDRCPWDMGTFGSLTTRMFGPALRAAAAEAREALLDLAAERLGAARDRLVVADGVVSVVDDPRRSVTYGALAAGEPIARHVGAAAVLRQAKEFRVMGRSPRRLDGLAKVTGGAEFTADVRRPGLLHARLLRPPSHGATLVDLDTRGAERLPGVSVVRRGDLVAVLHAEPETAAEALAALRASWQEKALDFDHESVFDHLLAVGGAGRIVGATGRPELTRRKASDLVANTFHRGYVAHAPLEPHVAVAEPAAGRMTVWASTQTPFPTRDDVAAALGLDKSKVRVLTPYVGGGFGGKSAHQQAVEAARLAQIVGKPVAVAWTREEEFFLDTFDPAAVVRIASALDANGRLTLWDYEVWGAGLRSTDLFYDVPNTRLRIYGEGVSYGPHDDAAGAPPPPLHPFAVGPWRAPGAGMNTFARESQLDLLAARAGADPLDFRLAHLSDARMRRVLETAADAYGWRRRPSAPGRGHGLACGIDAGTCVALMAEVTVIPASGKIRVERVVAAQDMGLIVNPDGARMQIEGCVTMGLGYTLGEELRFTGGTIHDRNFDTYELPRFSWLPRIETVLVENDALAPQGGGEPAIVPVGAAIANAVAAASGHRFLRLPMTPARVRAALAAGPGAAA